MSQIEIVRVLIFLAVVGIIFGAAFVIIFRQLAALLFRRRKFPRPISSAGKVILSLAFIGVLCIAYAHWVEPYWLEVTRVSAASPKLKGATRAIRIAHISDLHCDPIERVENKMTAMIAAEKPDFILFTGDTMNRPDSLPVLKATLTQLAKIAPTYVVKGNWDVWYYAKLDLFGGTGVHELNNEAVKVDIAGTSLWLIGAPITNLPNFDKAFQNVPADAYKIFLYHYPDEIEEAKSRGVDWYCAGHTHGGQVALPLYGALITFSKFGKKYESGLFHEGATSLYVNRGMGCEGTPHLRFFARPEITMIELVK